ncbi:MAG: hypothetical protein ACOYLO_14080 [Ferruginibacter sp.]
MKKYILASLALFLTVSIISCSKSSPSGNNGGTGGGGTITCGLSVSFSTNIKRILDANCTSCHAPANANALALAKWSYDGSYSSAFNNRSNISLQVVNGSMPQTGGLPSIVRDSIKCWVDKGAAN